MSVVDSFKAGAYSMYEKGANAIQRGGLKSLGERSLEAIGNVGAYAYDRVKVTEHLYGKTQNTEQEPQRTGTYQPPIVFTTNMQPSYINTPVKDLPTSNDRDLLIDFEPSSAPDLLTGGKYN